MNRALLDFFKQKTQENNGIQERALAEIIQTTVLLGLSRSDFFTKAAFYGGTALRILHGLDRFSEDLDFSLIEQNASFKIQNYFAPINDELQSFGLDVNITEKKKSLNTTTESAFVKTNTIIAIASITGIPAKELQLQNKTIKVKFEIDIDPPEGAQTEFRYYDEFVPFALRCYDLPSAFAGKMHALLARAWKNRIKGRDWYDLIFYIKKKVPLSLVHLDARFRQTGHYTKNCPLSSEQLMKMLQERILSIDFEQAKKDVEPFVERPQDLNVWNKDFFLYMVSKILFK